MDIQAELLAALKECREAAAAAMRVIADLDTGADTGEGVDMLLIELHRVGVSHGFGVRADQAIAKAEGRTPC
jgi:hypothetical protein